MAKTTTKTKAKTSKSSGVRKAVGAAKRTSKPKVAAKPKAVSTGSPATTAAKAGGGGKSGPKAKIPAKTRAAKPGISAQNKVKPVRDKAQTKGKPAQPKKNKRAVFDAKALSAIGKALVEERQDLQNQLDDIEATVFSPEPGEASGEAGFDDDYADAGTATFEREKDLSIANNIQDLIDKINKALEKIEDGSYGICESCGSPISADRLKALPHVLLCINCKKAEERR